MVKLFAFLCFLFIIISSIESASGATGGTPQVRTYKSTGVSIGSTLPKESTIGSKSYSNSQKNDVKSRFMYWSHGEWNFDDWNRWRMEDGMLCRSNSDCIWMDKMLECDRYRFGWDVSSGWFNNGSTREILGVCDCISTLVWRDEELECQEPGFFDKYTAFHICMVIFTILLILCACCSIK